VRGSRSEGWRLEASMEVPGIPRSHWWLDVSHDTRRTGHANLARAVVQDRIVASGGPKGSLQAVPYGEHDAVRDKGEFQRKPRRDILSV
jgi:hypothetical protein